MERREKMVKEKLSEEIHIHETKGIKDSFLQ